jgi:hypothetical protein
MKRWMKYFAIILVGISTTQEVIAIDLTQEDQERLAKGEVIVHLKAVRGMLHPKGCLGWSRTMRTSNSSCPM